MSVAIKRIKSSLAVVRHFFYFSDYKNYKNLVKSYENFEGNLLINDIKAWKKKMLKVAKYGHTFLDVGKDFFTTHINVLNQRQFDENEPIVVCVVKNDLQRIKVFLEYYRSLGIKHFAFLDDNSSDGTREFLLKQEDADVFASSESYTTNRRQAWVNRLIAYYGMNKWYLVVDSDELLSMKQTNIKNMIATASKARCRCLMVDMYPIDGNYSDDFVGHYRGFDIDTYDSKDKSIWFNAVRGGMRKRVFGTSDGKINPYLIKTPLFKATKNFIQIHSHFNYPFVYDKDFLGVLRHYKFLKADFEKYQERAKKQNFSNGSEEYSAYANRFSNGLCIDFKYDGSRLFNSYESFYQINIYKKNKNN